MNNQRAELHIHTNMSALDGINTAKEYIEAAIDNGLSAIAITDHASVQAFPEAYSAWENTGKKTKLIYGMEAYMPSDEGAEIFHTTILVKNKEGLKNLYRLISDAKQENPESIPLTLRCNIEKYREGLLIGSGCDAGELYSAILGDTPLDELCKIAAFYDFLEIVPNTIEEVLEINEEIVKTGEKIGKPVVAVSNAHSINIVDNDCRKALLNHYGLYDFDKQLKTTEEMLGEFLFLGKEKAYETVVENTKFISDMIDDTFPPFDLDAHYEADAEKFQKTVMKKATEKYGENIHPHIRSRINRELSLICSNELSVYNYIIGEKLVKRAIEKGWTVGSRGSVASSLVAHLIGITEINPLEAHYHCPGCHYIEFHTEFSCGVDMANKVCKCGVKLEKCGFTIPEETFLGIDGSRPADIDYNFAPEYQQEAFEHLEKELGTTIVRGGTVSTLSYKEAYNIATDFEFRDLFAQKLTNVKKADKMHPGRMIVFPEDKEVYDYTPVSRYCNGREETITHFNCNYTSDTYSFYECLNNIDFLTHEDPVIIKKLEELTNVPAKTIPLDDEETMKLFANLNTSGISEFSNPFVIEQIMKKAVPKSFDDLIRISALSHGTNTWTDNAEYLISEGKSISEVASTRDDVMLDLLKYGTEREKAYEISEQIRKGKGLTDEQYVELSNKGIEKWKLDSWSKILYSFPRAHVASYVLYAYRKAYYKAHYPQAFCQVINISGNA